MNATQGGANLQPGADLHPGVFLHPGANTAHERGLSKKTMSSEFNDIGLNLYTVFGLFSCLHLPLCRML